MPGSPQTKPTEALVKVTVAGVNSIDGHFRDGSLRTPLPFVPGQEGAGSGVGSRLAGKKRKGRRPRGLERSPRFLCRICSGREADSLVPLPANLSDQQAAAAMMQGLTAHYLANDAHKLKAGETALVHAAAGGVGLLLVQMARAIGARVIGTVHRTKKKPSFGPRCRCRRSDRVRPSGISKPK